MIAKKIVLQKNISITNWNTFGITARAAAVWRVRSVSALRKVLKKNDLDVFILGGGSNVLFTRDVDALLLKNELRGKSIVRTDENGVEVAVRSGENWHRFVLWCLKNQLAGVENLSLIPGTVGAAPIQNIGAYGVELKDVFVRLEAMDLATGTIHTFSKKDCRFGYRDSIFKQELKGKYFITKVVLRLQKFTDACTSTSYGAINAVLKEKNIKNPTPRDISNAVIDIRSSKLPDPKELGNAGSFFKNPVISAEAFATLRHQYPEVIHYDLPDGRVKIPAGWLIEHAGWKGKKVGNTGAHAKQALVLVNYGSATGAEVKLLSEQIIDSVFEKYGVQLEREVNIY